jgi:assimilatory nitrate reductase catalytic subunit
VSKVNRAVAPPAEARADFDIFLDLASALGCREELFAGWTTTRDAFEEWKRVSSGRLCDYSGMTYEAIEASGGIQWPYRAEDITKDPKAVRRLYADAQFPTDDGKARLLAATWEAFPEPPNREFPFVLNTGRTVEHWHTRTKTGLVPILERLSPRPWLEMNPRDGRALGLKPTERVDVVSRRGVIRNLDLRLTETVGTGQVFVPFHWAEANANQATQSAFDPISREPNYKQCAVRVERSR